MKKTIFIILILIGLMGLVIWSANKPKPAPTPVAVTETNADSTVAAEPAEPVVTPPPAETKPAEPKPEPPVVAAVVEPPPVTNAPETNVVSVLQPESNPPIETNSVTPNLLSDGTTKDEELFYRMRLGYEHADFGDSKDTWRLGAKVYYRPQSLRDNLKGQTNGVVAALIPDVYAEAGHAAVASTAAGNTPVIGDGVQFGVGAFWSLLTWSNKISWMTNDNSHEVGFSFGPTANGGFQVMTSGSQNDVEWSRYGGVRLAVGQDAFLEYVVGKTDGLPGLRHQVLAEFPIYQKTDSELRYVFRGLWNTSSSQGKDILSAALLIELPFDAVKHPSEFRDLIPFVK